VYHKQIQYIEQKVKEGPYGQWAVAEPALDKPDELTEYDVSWTKQN
jgi:hypothetical protein